MVRRTVGSKRLEASLVDRLKKLCKGPGLVSDNLYALLGAELREECGIGDTDSPEDVRKKAATRFNQLIGRLIKDENQTIARVCLNIEEDPGLRKDKLGDRREALQAAGGPSSKASYNRMYEEIIPALVRMMLSDRAGRPGD